MRIAEGRGISRVSRTSVEAGVYVGLALAQRAVAFVLLPFLIIALTPAEYGVVSVLSALVALLTAAAGLSLEIFVFRSTVLEQSHEIVQRVLSYLFFLVPGVALVLASALLLIHFEIFGVPSWALGAATLAAALSASNYSALLPTLRARHRLGPFVLVSVLSIAAQSGLTLLLVIGLDLGVEGWCFAAVGAAAVTYCLGLVLCRPRWHAPRLREPLSLTLPLVPHQLMMWALTFADRWILLALGGAALTGLYSLAYQCATVLGLVLMELNRALMPWYVKMSATSVDRGIRAHAAINVMLFSLFMAGTTVLQPLLFREEYSEAYQFLGPLVLSQLAYGLYFIPVNLLSLTIGRTSGVWRASATGAAANISLNVALIPHFGGWGAVSATIVGYLLMLVVATRLAPEASAMIRSAFPLTPACLLVATATAQSVVTMAASVQLQVVSHVTCLLIQTTAFFLVVRRLRPPPHSRNEARDAQENS
ncbi:MAG: polysaccharide biosynthesis C-terminal domain-containing protein [Propionibacteriales bacterium]|nr:polysaccharide biosynthesis C-terminal domain-containing protein [Propionibacteriales bacterium]